MKIDLVCSGGGVKGIALLGAIDYLHEQGFEVIQIAGTSVGAIIGALLQAGYRANELLHMLKTEELSFSFNSKSTFSNQLLGLKRWVELYWKLGLYKITELEGFLQILLRQKGINTFLDLPPDALQIVASDLTRQAIVTFPRDGELYELDQPLSIAEAACMSAAVPLFFRPKYLVHRKTMQKCMIVDGGILSNFPMWLFDQVEGKRPRPVIGLQLKSDIACDEVPKINNALALMKQMLQTMQTAHDREYIRKSYVKNVVFIPVGNVQATDFQLTKETVDILFESGRESCMKFLRTWSY